MRTMKTTIHSIQGKLAFDGGEKPPHECSRNANLIAISGAATEVAGDNDVEKTLIASEEGGGSGKLIEP